MKAEDINKEIKRRLTDFEIDIDVSKAKQKLNDIEKQLDRIIEKYNQINKD